MAVTNGSTGRCDGRRGPEGGSNGVMWLKNSWSWCIPLMLNMRPGALCLLNCYHPAYLTPGKHIIYKRWNHTQICWVYETHTITKRCTCIIYASCHGCNGHERPSTYYKSILNCLNGVDCCWLYVHFRKNKQIRCRGGSKIFPSSKNTEWNPTSCSFILAYLFTSCGWKRDTVQQLLERVPTTCKTDC